MHDSPTPTPTPPPVLGPLPPDNSNRSLSFIRGVVLDAPPFGSAFGAVVQDVPAVVRRGVDPPASAVFVGANPRNNLRLEGSYAVVERFVTEADPRASSSSSSSPAHGDGSGDELRREPAHGPDAGERQPPQPTAGRWVRVRDDSDWQLVFRWRRRSELLATSEVTLAWEPEPWAAPGRYRLRYFGDARSITGTITPFEGVSGEFDLVA